MLHEAVHAVLTTHSTAHHVYQISSWLSRLVANMQWGCQLAMTWKLCSSSLLYCKTLHFTNDQNLIRTVLQWVSPQTTPKLQGSWSLVSGLSSGYCMCGASPVLPVWYLHLLVHVPLFTLWFDLGLHQHKNQSLLFFTSDRSCGLGCFLIAILGFFCFVLFFWLASQMLGWFSALPVC